MADYGWVYTSCDAVITGAAGDDGGIQFKTVRTGTDTHISGSWEFSILPHRQLILAAIHLMAQWVWAYLPRASQTQASYYWRCFRYWNALCQTVSYELCVVQHNL